MKTNRYIINTGQQSHVGGVSPLHSPWMGEWRPHSTSDRARGRVEAANLVTKATSFIGGEVAKVARSEGKKVARVAVGVKVRHFQRFWSLDLQK